MYRTVQWCTLCSRLTRSHHEWVDEGERRRGCPCHVGPRSRRTTHPEACSDSSRRTSRWCSDAGGYTRILFVSMWSIISDSSAMMHCQCHCDSGLQLETVGYHGSTLEGMPSSGAGPRRRCSLCTCGVSSTPGAGTLYMYNCFNALHKVKSMTQIHAMTQTHSAAASASQPVTATVSRWTIEAIPPVAWILRNGLQLSFSPSDKYTHDSRRHSLRSTT